MISDSQNAAFIEYFKIVVEGFFNGLQCNQDDHLEKAEKVERDDLQPVVV